MGYRTSLGAAIALCAAISTGCGSSSTEPDDAPDAGAPGSLAATLDGIIDETGVASITVAVIGPDAPTTTVSRGYADVDAERAATPETIYGLASCSKPFVGLAAAILIEDDPDFDLDADVNDWLEWDPPLAHPLHPDTPVTMRMLLSHTAGIAADSPADYESYPKPDPDTALDPFLRPLLADPAYWLAEPGAAYEYSNLGVALAARVIEAATGEDFRRYTEDHIFDPLGLDDTRWFYADLDASQRARHALPYDADGEAYEIYAFNDYPSGLLRSTADDLAVLMQVLAGGGRLDGEALLPASVVERFHALPMLIEHERSGSVDVWSHSGGEAGITTWFTYRSDGRGYLYLVNTDLEDDETDALEDALTAALEPIAGFR